MSESRWIALLVSLGALSPAPLAASHGALICLPGGPYVAECTGGALTYELDGSASRDPAGLPLIYHWESHCPGAVFDDAGAARTRLTVPYQPGCAVVCEVHLEVDNRNGKTDHCEASVVALDSEPPLLSVGSLPAATLWPPNHRQVCLELDQLAGIAAADSCDPSPGWVFSGCSVNEPARPGACEVVDAGRGICVRAERNGNGSGRRYRVEAAAVDACGNRSAPLPVFEWLVPHDQGQDR